MINSYTPTNSDNIFKAKDYYLMNYLFRYQKFIGTISMASFNSTTASLLHLKTNSNANAVATKTNIYLHHFTVLVAMKQAVLIVETVS
jgi:hypothetical protein